MTKATFSKRLNLSLIKAQPDLVVRRTEVIPAPEFGEDYTVIVKGMTAADRHLLGELGQRRAQHFYAEASSGVDSPEFMYSSQCIMAALCAVDEEGALVFGATPREAIETVSNLPAAYTDLISRIVVKAMAITSGGVGNDKEAIDDAEKN